jgi:hypothetical protein
LIGTAVLSARLDMAARHSSALKSGTRNATSAQRPEFSRE